MAPVGTIIEDIQSTYTPQTNLLPEEQVNQQRLAFLVGLVSFALPAITIFSGTFLATCFYQTISHFYYSQFLGSVFIGCLFFIGAYLLAWQGQSRGERWLASIAGLITWIVALFPTSGAGCTKAEWEGRVFADITRESDGTIKLSLPQDPGSYFELLPWAASLHAGAALILFCVLAWFSLVVFTRVVEVRDRLPDGSLTAAKAARNRIYVTCGWVIIAMVLLVLGRAAYEMITGQVIEWWAAYRLTFWAEAVALFAFGISWMVKGRFLGYAFTDTRHA